MRLDAFIPVAILDRPLTDEELQAVVDINAEMLGAGIA
jgi:hypothetical protein